MPRAAGIGDGAHMPSPGTNLLLLHAGVRRPHALKTCRSTVRAFRHRLSCHPLDDRCGSSGKANAVRRHRHRFRHAGRIAGPADGRGRRRRRGQQRQRRHARHARLAADVLQPALRRPLRALASAPPSRPAIGVAKSADTFITVTGAGTRRQPRVHQGRRHGAARLRRRRPRRRLGPQRR